MNQNNLFTLQQLENLTNRKAINELINKIRVFNLKEELTITNRYHDTKKGIRRGEKINKGEQ